MGKLFYQKVKGGWPVLCIGLLLGSVLRGDIVETANGARLVGKIEKIEGGVIYLETEYAGKLQVKQSEATGISSDEPLYVRLRSGKTMPGKLEESEGEGLKLSGEEGDFSAAVDEVEASWQLAGEDPDLRRLREEKEAARHKWVFKTGLDLTGKSGNSDETGTQINFSATREGPRDKLNFHFNINQSRKNGENTADEIKGGADYSFFLKKKLGWFVSSELETDEFEDLDLRATASGGLSYRILNKPRETLEGRGGISYRSESFKDGRNLNSPAGNAGLSHSIELGKWGKMTNNLKFMPSLEDFGDFRVTHDSGLEIPLGLSKFWKLRLGISNFYNSSPSPGKERLDTTYYTRLILTWGR